MLEIRLACLPHAMHYVQLLHGHASMLMYFRRDQIRKIKRFKNRHFMFEIRWQKDHNTGHRRNENKWTAHPITKVKNKSPILYLSPCLPKRTRPVHTQQRTVTTKTSNHHSSHHSSNQSCSIPKDTMPRRFDANSKLISLCCLLPTSFFKSITRFIDCVPLSRRAVWTFLDF